MADKNAKTPRNIAGIYYVDSNCCDCDLCREITPGLFSRDDETGSSYVFRQPASDDEKQLADEARSGCPTESIGNDG